MRGTADNDAVVGQARRTEAGFSTPCRLAAMLDIAAKTQQGRCEFIYNVASCTARHRAVVRRVSPALVGGI